MSKIRMPRFARVQVEWVDSASHDGWQTISEAKSNHRNKLHCRSVGILVIDNKHGITIAHSLHQNLVAGTMHIPRGAITKVRRLR